MSFNIISFIKAATRQAVPVAEDQPLPVYGAPAPAGFGTDGYETVGAGVTAQVLGGAGATGDHIAALLVVPATTSPGSVTVLDNATSIPVFTGGGGSVSNLVPFTIFLGARSVSGPWKVSTGANVSVVAFGRFTS